MRRGLVVIAILASAPAVPAPAWATLQQGSHGPAVLALQNRLVDLRYLAKAARNGVYGVRTTQAVMAFQGWVGLTRDGVDGPTTFTRLHKADRPIPWNRNGRHMEVHKARQVLLLIAKSGKLVRAIHVSTAAPGHVTPSGHFTIIRKERMSWSRLFSVWMPYADYFYSGYAFHQYPSVPGYPASHGCIRIADRDAIVVWYFATLGTRLGIA